MPNSPFDIGWNAALPMVASWFLTYVLHSTLLIGAVWVIDRRRGLAMVTRDALWKFATVGALVTATAQLGFGIRPLGELHLPGTSPAPVSVPDSRVEQPDPLPPVTLARDEVQAARFEDLPSSARPAPSHPLAGSADVVAARAAPPSARTIPWRAVILLAWLVVALGGVLRLGSARRRLHRIMRTRRPITDPFLLAVTNRLARRAKLRDGVALTWSTDVPAPAAFSREICLPKRALSTMSEEHLQGIIAHELAHIARRDILWFGTALLIERIFFFQPLNFLARRRLQESAEYLCDDWAVGQTGQPLTMAECLAEVAEWIQHAGRPILAPSMAEQGSRLVRRVQRILHTMPSSGPVPLRRMSWAPVTLGVAVTLFAPGVTPFDANDGNAADPLIVVATTERAPSDIVSGNAYESNAVMLAPAALAPSFVGRTGSGLRAPDFTRPTVAIPLEGVVAASSSMARVAPSPETYEAPAAQDTVDPRVIQSLIAALDDEDVVVRREAAAALARLRAVPAIPALTGLLQDPDDDVRRVATAALARMRDERAVDGLVLALRDAQPEVRKAAAEGLGPYRTDAAYRGLLTLLRDSEPALRREAILQLEKQERVEAAPQIVPLMRDEAEPVRRAAVWAIGELRYRDATQQLLAATRDTSETIRYYALRGLVRLEEPAARPALARALEDPSARVRAVAARALGEYGDSASVPALIQAAGDADGDVREYALRALREIGDARAATAYTTALRDAESDVREAAIRGLAELGNEMAVPALASQLDSSLPRQIRETATRALTRFRSTEAADALMTALRDPDAEVRQIAVAGLGRIRDVRAMTPLVNALQDEEPDVREQAIRALAEFKSANTVEPFIHALDDESADVRALAARALGQLRDPRAVDPLIVALEDPDTSVRRAAVRALAAFPNRE
jgi:HEAT repeat protein/beta-lactamase regulating signal transducer with metallopeptidase domain